jgi:hypothetical protein
VIQDIPEAQRVDDFGLLDIALALAKNIKAIVFVPLVLGLIVYGLTSLLPKTYTSVAVLNNQPTPYTTKTAGFDNVTAADVLLRTSGVLDAVAAKFNLPGNTPGERRSALDRKISVAKVRNQKAVTLSVTSGTPEASRDIARALIEAWLPFLRPIGSDLKTLEDKIKAIDADQERLAARIKMFEQQSLNKDTALALVTLYSQQRDNTRDRLDVKAQIAGQGFDDVVVSGPTLPDEGQNKYWFLAPLMTAASFFVIAISAVVMACRSESNSEAVARKKSKIIAALTPNWWPF